MLSFLLALLIAATQALTQNELTSFGVSFSETLRDLASNLKYEEMQNIYNTAQATSEEFNTREQLDALSQEVTHRLSKKTNALQTVRQEIETLALNRDTLSSGDDLQCCNYDQQDEYSKAFKNVVDLESICIRIPQGQQYSNAEVVTARDLSRPLGELWKDLYRDDRDLRWMYYGDESGLFRKFPADKSASCNSYDPRFRPWYVAAITPVPKNVILIIDTSGSMMTIAGGVSRMDIAIDAALTVLSTLGPNDYIYVMEFNSNPRVPDGCHGNQMVKATPENIDILKEWVRSLGAGGETYYATAFERAFEMYVRHREISPTDPTAIVFLTDGVPSDQEDWMGSFDDFISGGYDEHVYVFTYGFGDGIAQDAGQRLADMANYMQNAGYSTVIPDGGDLRTELGKYYTFEAFQRVDTSYDAVEIVWTVPYLDFSGLGLITTAAVPVFDRTNPSNPVPLGVVAMDTPLEDLLQDIAAFESESTYGFVVDTRGRTMVHPNLPAPEAYSLESHPVYLDISILETATTDTGVDVFGANIDGVVRRQMLQQLDGCLGNLEAIRAKSLGDAEYSGAIQQAVETEYCWAAIEGTTFTLGIAKSISYEQKVTPDPDNGDVLPDTDVYHRLDLQDLANVGDLCNQLGSMATKEHSAFMVAPKGYTDKFSYSVDGETTNDIEDMVSYVEQRGNSINFDGVWKDGVLEDILITSLIEDDWVDLLTDRLGDYTIWRYIGTTSGVFRMYPGHEMPHLYDTTARPWFYRSVAYPGDIVISAPYQAASGVGTVITLSTSIENKFGECITAVMGMDFTVGKFLSILDEVVGDSCDGIDTKCMVMDTSGFLVLHTDFLTSRNDGLCNPFVHGNIFIGQCEPSLARYLITENFLIVNACNNFEDRKNQKFWKVNDQMNSSWSGTFSSNSQSCSHFTSDFYVSPVPGTNMYLIAYDVAEDSFCIDDCNCSGGECSNDVCHCVCQEELDFDECTEKFDASTAAQPICPLAPPDIGVVDVDFDDEPCFSYTCEEQDETGCTALDCVWCILAPGPYGDYRKVSEPYCIEGFDFSYCELPQEDIPCDEKLQSDCTHPECLWCASPDPSLNRGPHCTLADDAQDLVCDYQEDEEEHHQENFEYCDSIYDKTDCTSQGCLWCSLYVRESDGKYEKIEEPYCTGDITDSSECEPTQVIMTPSACRTVTTCYAVILSLVFVFLN